METKLLELKKRMGEINDLQSAANVLSWDLYTYMPPKGAAARSRQRATLGRLAHEKLTDPAVGQLLEDLRPYEENLSYDDDDAALLRFTRRQYERAVKIPILLYGRAFRPWSRHLRGMDQGPTRQ